jgi:hypothetical protein
VPIVLQRPKTIEVFFSYSHRDEKLRDKLEKHLSILKRHAAVRSWHDRKIGAGTEWKGQIDEHLNTAGLILLLVSDDFLASDYCWDVEVKRAMGRHEVGATRVIPVILRQCDWKRAPFGALQALPKDGRPVTSWSNRDEAFYNVATGIRAAVEELTAKPPSRIFKTTRSVPESELYRLRRLPDSSFTSEEIELLVKDSEERAQRFVPDAELRREICQAAEVLLKQNKGESLSKKQLEKLDGRFLARGKRKPDAEIVRWVLRAARLHPQGRVVR